MSEIITHSAVRDAHTAFCKNMDFDPDTWKAVFEFSAYVGFWCINITRKDIRNEGIDVSVSHKAWQRIDFLLGDNAPTLTTAYKVQRYSWRCRPKVFLKKCTHMALFVFAVIIAFIVEVIHG